MSKKKITHRECREIAAELISGMYQRVALFADEYGNQMWNAGTGDTVFNHDPDHVATYSYTSEYTSTKTELGKRMYDKLNEYAD